MYGKMGDTNGYVGMQWNALYVSHDPKAGSPIMASAMTMEDKIISDKSYKPIHYFGQTSPISTNLHTFNGSSSPSIYVYWLQDLSIPAAASVFSNTTVNIAVLTGIGSLGIGIVIGAIIFRRKKKEQKQEAPAS